MAKYVDKDALVAEIDKRKIGYNTDGKHSVEYNTVKKILDILNTIEVKEVIAEQECTCNEALNRIIGGSWNLLCPVNKLELKTGDKVKVIIKAQKEE